MHSHTATKRSVQVALEVCPLTMSTPMAQDSMLTQYLFVFAQVHDEFRIPELLSISELYGFDIKFPEDKDISRPFMILGLESEEHARLLARRCILIR